MIDERLERLAALGDEAAARELRKQKQRREPVAHLLGPFGGTGVSQHGDGYGYGYGYGCGYDYTKYGDGFGCGYGEGDGDGVGVGCGDDDGDGEGSGYRPQNGVGYREIARPEEKEMPGGELYVVVCAYGWVYVGYVKNEGLRAHMRGGAVIEKWGTEDAGIGQLALEGPQRKTRLRREPPCSWPIHGAEVRRTRVCEGALQKWEDALAALWRGYEKYSGMEAPDTPKESCRKEGT